jgi:hypothetical protein
MGSSIDKEALCASREDKLRFELLEICETVCRSECKTEYKEYVISCMQKYYYSGAPYYVHKPTKLELLYKKIRSTSRNTPTQKSTITS